MEFKLGYSAKISIDTKIRCNYIETNISIDDNHNELKESFLNTIFNEDGIDTLKKCITDDMFFELLNEKQELLHDYLTRHGYIFNKA